VPPSLEEELTTARRGLETRLEKAMLSPSEAVCISPEHQNSLRWIVRGRIGRVRLLNIINLPDSGSCTDPLAGFAMLKGGGSSEFAQATTQLGLAWAMAWPPHSASAQLFVAKLQKYVLGKREERGTPWSALSKYYLALMRTVDHGAHRFALGEEHATFRVAPSIDWIDGPYEYVRLLNEAAQDANMAAAMQLLRDEFAAAAPSSRPRGLEAEVDDAKAKLTKAKDKRKAARKEAAQRKKARERAKTAAGGPATAAALLAAPPDQVAGSQLLLTHNKGGVLSSQDKIQAGIDAKHPPINGRKACSFFFGPQKFCKFSPEVCGNGHHGV